MSTKIQFANKLSIFDWNKVTLQFMNHIGYDISKINVEDAETMLLLNFYAQNRAKGEILQPGKAISVYVTDGLGCHKLNWLRDHDLTLDLLAQTKGDTLGIREPVMYGANLIHFTPTALELQNPSKISEIPSLKGYYKPTAMDLIAYHNKQSGKPKPYEPVADNLTAGEINYSAFAPSQAETEKNERDGNSVINISNQPFNSQTIGKTMKDVELDKEFALDVDAAIQKGAAEGKSILQMFSTPTSTETSKEMIMRGWTIHTLIDLQKLGFYLSNALTELMACHPEMLNTITVPLIYSKKTDSGRYELDIYEKPSIDHDKYLLFDVSIGLFHLMSYAKKRMELFKKSPVNPENWVVKKMFSPIRKENVTTPPQQILINNWTPKTLEDLHRMGFYFSKNLAYLIDINETCRLTTPIVSHITVSGHFEITTKENIATGEFRVFDWETDPIEAREYAKMLMEKFATSPANAENWKPKINPEKIGLQTQFGENYVAPVKTEIKIQRPEGPVEYELIEEYPFSGMKLGQKSKLPDCAKWPRYFKKVEQPELNEFELEIINYLNKAQLVEDDHDAEYHAKKLYKILKEKSV